MRCAVRQHTVASERGTDRVELHFGREVLPVGSHLGVNAGQPELADLPLGPLKQLAYLGSSRCPLFICMPVACLSLTVHIHDTHR